MLFRSYAKYIPGEDRKESWGEVVDRYMNFFRDYLRKKRNYEIEEFEYIRNCIYEQKVMPSMRCLLTSGPALERSHIGAYNCSAVAMNNVTAFPEILLLLMNGTGVGFSVERHFVDDLPLVPDSFTTSASHVIEDSKEGWYDALKVLIDNLFNGILTDFDISKVRKKGEILKTFGGFASGPEPLMELFNFTTSIFKNAHGRRLTSLECHDIMCKIGEVVVVGGV